MSPILLALIAVAVVAVLVVVVVAVVARRKVHRYKALATEVRGANAAAPRVQVAFENPMYARPPRGAGGSLRSNKSEGLYSEPAFMSDKENPLYQETETDNYYESATTGDGGDFGFGEGGYLDVAPEES